jgi:hypothetical protein
MGWSVDDMVELGRRHADIEGERRLDPLMETLVEDPSYEFHPIGLGMRGGERVRRYYTQFFGGFMEQMAGYTLLNEWADENAVVQEYDITLEAGADGPETHRVIGILFAERTPDGRTLLGGERVYASERCIRLMTGELFDELVPLD